MARNMSFMLTTTQIKDKSKTVTRRNGWSFLLPGDVLNACVKCMGLQKGEKIQVICKIRVKSCRWEPLNQITQEDCKKEGFPHFSPKDFVDMYVAHYPGLLPSHKVHRIEFEYLQEEERV